MTAPSVADSVRSTGASACTAIDVSMPARRSVSSTRLVSPLSSRTPLCVTVRKPGS
jgi:hypothetical protein